MISPLLESCKGFRHLQSRQTRSRRAAAAVKPKPRAVGALPQAVAWASRKCKEFGHNGAGFHPVAWRFWRRLLTPVSPSRFCPATSHGLPACSHGLWCTVCGSLISHSEADPHVARRFLHHALSIPGERRVDGSAVRSRSRAARGLRLTSNLALSYRKSRRQTSATDGTRLVSGGLRRLAADLSGRQPDHSGSGCSAMVLLHITLGMPVAAWPTDAPAPVARPVAASWLHRQRVLRIARRKAARRRPVRPRPSAAAPTCSACR